MVAPSLPFNGDGRWEGRSPELSNPTWSLEREGGHTVHDINPALPIIRNIP